MLSTDKANDWERPHIRQWYIQSAETGLYLGQREEGPEHPHLA